MQRLFVFLMLCVLHNLSSASVPAAEPHCDDKTITLAVETELAVDLQISSHLIDQAAGAPVTQPLSLWPTETSLRVGPTTLLRRVWH